MQESSFDKAVTSWLSQFDVGDRDLARTLVSSLSLISHNELQRRLRRLIERLLPEAEALALYAVREVGDDEVYFSDKRKRPFAVLAGGPGSEGTLAYLVKTLAAQHRRIKDHCAIATLRKQRIHHIVLLDDMSSSGLRVERFLRSMLRSDTMKSWLSFGWIKFHLVSYAISESAEERVSGAIRSKRRRAKLRERIAFHYIQRPTDRDDGPQDRLGEFKRLAKSYGKRGRLPPQFHTGFGDEFALTIFEHRVPNNVPAILWCSTKIWAPLFPARSVPAQMGGAFDLDPVADRIVKRANANLAVAGKPVAATRLRWLPCYLVLDALRRKVRHPAHLPSATGLSTATVASVLSVLKEAGLVGSANVLTQTGQKELRRLTQFDEEKSSAPGAKEAYFPQRLRESRGEFSKGQAQKT